MNKFLSAVFALALTTALALSSGVQADTSLQFGIGYRSDNINWKIKADDDKHPKTESHLNFRDLEIFTLQARLKGVCGDCMYYRADGQYGWVLDGTVRESDQFANGSPSDAGLLIQYGSTHNDIRRNYVADFNFAVGYPIQQCWCPCLQIVPTLGFAYDTQRLRQKGHHSIYEALEANGFDAGEVLYGSDDDRRDHSRYRATFWGPWIGFDLAFCHTECWDLYGEFQYHFGTRARRERNSKVGNYEIDRYERTKSAQGVTLRGGGTYAFRCNWFADAYVVYKRFTSHEHRDNLSWRSIGVGLDVGYVF